MIITSQGYGHFTKGINNQDFSIETSKMLLLLDGCSEAKYAEVGTRLFAQLFSRKEDCDNVDKFEDNVKEVFEEIFDFSRKYYPNQEVFEQEFIMENMLFTIIACFETESSFIVKLFGDGYVITQNVYGSISYIKFSYGKCPPYFAYKYCQTLNFNEYEFKTFSFDKQFFKNVGIASDGIMPLVKDNNKPFDRYISNRSKNTIISVINNNKKSLFDDTTIAMFGGDSNGKT